MHSSSFLLVWFGLYVKYYTQIYPTYLQEVSVNYVPNEQCINSYIATKNNVTDDMLCAASPGRDAWYVFCVLRV